MDANVPSPPATPSAPSAAGQAAHSDLAGTLKQRAEYHHRGLELSRERIPIPAKESRGFHSGHDKATWDYVWKSFVAGGLAGCAAKSAVAPLDRVKILFQTHAPAYAHHQGSFQGIFRAVRDIRSNHGVAGLFQGHSATLMRIFPYAAIKFMAFEQYKRILCPESQPPSPFRESVAGALAGVTTVFFTYPLEVVRVRLAFSKDPTTIRGLLYNMYGEHPHLRGLPDVFGRLSNFYRGFLPTVYGMVPYAGVSFMVFHTMKRAVQDHRPTWTPSQVHLLAGGVAGAVSQTASYPFEVIRRRMQVGGHFRADSFEAQVYRNTVETARYIYRRQGLRGFFVGLTIGYIKVIPMSMVSFWTYEACKELLLHW